MGNQSTFDKVREWLGGIAFDIFLWSIRMTQDEYLDTVVRESGLTKRAVDVCPACDGKGIKVMGIHHETCLTCNGSGIHR